MIAIIDYDARSVGAVRYKELAQEFIDRREKSCNINDAESITGGIMG